MLNFFLMRYLIGVMKEIIKAKNPNKAKGFHKETPKPTKLCSIKNIKPKRTLIELIKENLPTIKEFFVINKNPNNKTIVKVQKNKKIVNICLLFFRVFKIFFLLMKKYNSN
ncbi:hypothetical protein HOK76_02965 [archaeon]|nr:hypothetical protein [archaeon]